MNATWLKSSYSDTGGNCVECRTEGGHVLIRDTQNRYAGHLTFTATEWSAFTAELEKM